MDNRPVWKILAQYLNDVYMIWEFTKWIWAQLEVLMRSYSRNMLIGVSLGDLPFKCHLAICRPKNTHPVCLIFEPLRLQMTKIANIMYWSIPNLQYIATAKIRIGNNPSEFERKLQFFLYHYKTGLEILYTSTRGLIFFNH